MVVEECEYLLWREEAPRVERSAVALGLFGAKRLQYSRKTVRGYTGRMNKNLLQMRKRCVKLPSDALAMQYTVCWHSKRLTHEPNRHKHTSLPHPPRS